LLVIFFFFFLFLQLKRNYHQNDWMKSENRLRQHCPPMQLHIQYNLPKTKKNAGGPAAPG